MGDYVRTTREATFDNLNPNLITALRTHIEKHELGDINSALLMCCETTSSKQKKGLFGGKSEVILVAVILTPQWLIWAVSKDNESAGVLSAQLRNIQVQDYETSEMNKLIQDTGVNISGIGTDAVNLGSAFIGFGAEPAAQKFRALLKETHAKA